MLLGPQCFASRGQMFAFKNHLSMQKLCVHEFERNSTKNLFFSTTFEEEALHSVDIEGFLYLIRKSIRKLGFDT